MRCDLTLAERYLKMAEQFQSLLGFLMRCDMRSSGRHSPGQLVSIPAGFSDALRL